MEHDDDVERLFSWLKTPDLRYREFAAAREIADAVAAWPALRKTAIESGHPEEAMSAEPAPPANGGHGLDRVMPPPAAVEPAPVQNGRVEPPAAPIEDTPHPPRGALGERLMGVLGRRAPARRIEPGYASASEGAAEHPRERPPEADLGVGRIIAEEVVVQREVTQRESVPGETVARVVVERPAPAPPPPSRSEPAPGEGNGGRGALFGGTYRGFDEDGPGEAPPTPGRHDPGSLDAIFSRLARSAQSHRDTRGRAASRSGLGPVFRRLR